MSALPADPVSVYRAQSVDVDPRGILWMFEPPKPTEVYVVGCDPTVGIEGWNRALRTRDDVKTDNCVIQVVRVGRNGRPDAQAAEYAAPISQYQQAAVLSHIGRMYRGATDMGEALVCMEVWPGPGTGVIQPMVHLHGYTNFWTMKYLDQIYPNNKNLNKWPGWYSSRKSLRDLWLRSNHFVSIPLDGKDDEGKPAVVDWDERRRDENGIILRSPWLMEEMGNCQIDPAQMRAVAAHGHDDRWMALSLALWASHDWVNAPVPDITEKPVRRVNWQASDISLENLMEEWEQRVDELMEA